MNKIRNDYALASGGIFWKIFDRSRFESRDQKHKVSIIIALVLLCWLPLAALSLYQLGWNQFYQLFLKDINTQVRFLFVLPLLFFARASVNKSFNNMIGFFQDTEIVSQNNQQEFKAVLDRIEKWCNSWVVDLILIIFVYSTFFLKENQQINESNVYAPWHIINGKIAIAGWWYLIFSLPVFQILIYRWMYTIVLWILFIRKISKLDLNLSALHPDGAGGLGFLKYTQRSFFPVALAISAVVASVLNNMIVFSGITVIDYKIAIGAVLVFVLLLFMVPLLQLMPLLSKVKRKYFMEFSLQAWPLARLYEQELKTFKSSGGEKPDSSQQIDLVGSFEKAKEMNVVLIDKTMIITFTLTVIVPFLPVLAQQIPLKEIFIAVLDKIV
jgi:hypothetical protein